MNFSTPLCLSFLVAGALACELRVVPGDSDTDDSSGTEGGSSGGATEGGTASTASASTSASGGTNATEPNTATSTSATSGVTTDMTSGSTTLTTTTTAGTGMTSVGTLTTTGDPVDPVPCDGPATPIVAEVMAFTQAQIPPDPNPTGTGGSATTGGDPLHPDTVHVRLSSQANTCQDPEKVISCGPNWEVEIVIPPEFQTPGLYQLLGPDVIGSAFETGVDNGGNDCSFGGGSFSASFELISIDAQQVVGRLCHVDSLFFDNNPNLEGSFTAPRCP